jgi:hypothetical protein
MGVGEYGSMGVGEYGSGGVEEWRSVGRHIVSLPRTRPAVPLVGVGPGPTPTHLIVKNSGRDYNIPIIKTITNAER